MNIQLTDTRQFYINSNAINTIKHNGQFNSDITFNIPNFLKQNENILYSTIKVLHAEIPFSFYTVNVYNNYFKFNDVNIVIPEGNYSAYTLMNKINDLIQNVDVSANLTLNTVDGRYRLTSVSTFTLDVNEGLAHKLLGLDKTIYNAFFLTFPHPVNLLGTKNLYIKVDNIIIDNVNLITNDKSTLISIPVNVSPFSTILYNNTEQSENLIKQTVINDDIRISITDDDDNLIDFNNIDWSFTIQVKSVINTIRFNKNINEYLTEEN